ncbi:hypothetical protein [Sphingomonas radiodurans]|uniref:hypothetical protein n=1 Tax=Sphingomonas radiodurans TaxID=2890321 RepID=UPI001E607060|nr:hypothetical protein [Sphingomonas radiodurans]WBH16245.1 hypothetical protein LLW23_15780 [Sphingomonas radiodurans]
MIRTIVTGLGVLLLAGCEVPMPEQANDTPMTEGGFNMVHAADASVPTVEPSADTAGRLPAAFLGRWGLVPADCTSTRGDNKGLMTVEADRLSFYESRATIAKLAIISPTELRATLAFTGEGQEWTQDTPLMLEHEGNVLTRFADGQTLRYTRCGV